MCLTNNMYIHYSCPRKVHEHLLKMSACHCITEKRNIAPNAVFLQYFEILFKTIRQKYWVHLCFFFGIFVGNAFLQHAFQLAFLFLTLYTRTSVAHYRYRYECVCQGTVRLWVSSLTLYLNSTGCHVRGPWCHDNKDTEPARLCSVILGGQFAFELCVWVFKK